MREYSQSLVMDILRKEFPEIESRIHQRIDTDIPKKLTDLDLIPNIVSSFKNLKGIDHDTWMSDVTVGKRDKLNEDRDLLLAVIMLYYHPEKIMRITDENTKYGLMRKLSLVLELEGKGNVIRQSLAAVIVAFRAYKSFRNETYQLYELIKIENNFFE